MSKLGKSKHQLWHELCELIAKNPEKVILYVRTYVCMYVCTYVCMYVCIHTFICMCNVYYESKHYIILYMHTLILL